MRMVVRIKEVDRLLSQPGDRYRRRTAPLCSVRGGAPRRHQRGQGLDRFRRRQRAQLNMGPKKPIGENENRSEIPCRPLVMLQVMFKPNVVEPEFGNPVLGNAMVGFM
jgi:hypothetical protein